MDIALARQHGVGGNHRGLNMALASGRPFYPSDPRPEDVCILDIAASLSRICRYNGHIKDSVEMYSDAEHSVLVSHLVPPHLAFQALLHDAHEAYCVDLIRSIKLTLGGVWDQVERPLAAVVAERFGIPKTMHPLIKEADTVAVAIERRDILSPNDGTDWGTLPTIETDHFVVGLLPSAARELFLRRFFELGGEL